MYSNYVVWLRLVDQTKLAKRQGGFKMRDVTVKNRIKHERRDKKCRIKHERRDKAALVVCA